MQELTRQVSRLADAVERMAPTNTVAPNYQRPLESFTQFDWASISATVERSDQYGAAVVNWLSSAVHPEIALQQIWGSRLLGPLRWQK